LTFRDQPKLFPQDPSWVMTHRLNVWLPHGKCLEWCLFGFFTVEICIWSRNFQM